MRASSSTTTTTTANKMMFKKYRSTTGCVGGDLNSGEKNLASVGLKLATFNFTDNGFLQQLLDDIDGLVSI